MSDSRRAKAVLEASLRRKVLAQEEDPSQRPSWRVCPGCQGRGTASYVSLTSPDWTTGPTTCGACHGTGGWTNTCVWCSAEIPADYTECDDCFRYEH